jgi:hypothetical protein
MSVPVMLSSAICAVVLKAKEGLRRMNTIKLREVLAEIESQKLALDEAATGIRKVLGLLEGQTAPRTSLVRSTVDESRSYIDDAVALFSAEGEVMHVKLMAERLSELRGVKVSRASLESSFIRHIAKAKQPRIAKLGPSKFGLPEWKQLQPTLAQIA